MKLLTFSLRSDRGATPRIGVLLANGKVVDLSAASVVMSGRRPDFFANMLAFLEAGQVAREHAQQIIKSSDQLPANAMYQLNELSLLAPVPRPRSIRDCMSFERHVVQAIHAVLKKRHLGWLVTLDRWSEKCFGRRMIRAPGVWYERPLYYKGNPMSVVGPEAEVHWPSYTKRLDYELEFGVFIGRRGRNISSDEAKDYIGGYTIFNDFSARDEQFREMRGRLGPAKGKDFDTGNSLGPYLVTPEEIPDPYNLTMIARVNGEEWSRGSSREMFYSFEEIIACISQDETVYPGEFIGSGTVGNGCALELGRWLEPGDGVELEVEHLGVLRNVIVGPKR